MLNGEGKKEWNSVNDFVLSSVCVCVGGCGCVCVCDCVCVHSVRDAVQGTDETVGRKRSNSKKRR